MTVKLRMTGRQYAMLREHLLPGDALEAAAVLLCGRRRGSETHVLTVQKIVPIPHDACRREANLVVWPTESIRPLVEAAALEDIAIVKVHSHPNGTPRFSPADDASDLELFDSVYGWTGTNSPHASAVMLPNGRMIARTCSSSGEFTPIKLVTVAGEDLLLFPSAWRKQDSPEFSSRHRQAFGLGTDQIIRQLHVAVVGCSGTGSIVVEQLTRLGVRKLTLIDPDIVEEKNLNRIVNARRSDVGKPKVHVLHDAAGRMGLGTLPVSIRKNLAEPDSILAVAESDVVFGCMDGSEGRHLLNRICSFYCLPYFDVGVRLEADGRGGISQICGGVNYLQPDGSSLLSRGVITMAAVQAEGLKRTSPELYANEREHNYIAGVEVERPAVISVNMHYASLAVLEFLARIHPYRNNGNSAFAWHGSTLTGGSPFSFPDGTPCEILAPHVGRGDVLPLLDLPSVGASIDLPDAES